MPDQVKLKILIISMGGRRQEVLSETLSSGLLLDHFDVSFAPGVPSRSLRSRESFFRHCHTAGLLPEQEWTALQAAFTNPFYIEHGERFFECLNDIPISPGRRGSEYDVSVHYSIELWRKAKTVNRGRAVLACALAHLMALKRCTDEQFDVLLEDNVRMPVDSLAERMRTIIGAVKEYEQQTGTTCHMRYFGWLGSIPNLKWNYETYMHRLDDVSAVVPCPIAQDIEANLEFGDGDDSDEGAGKTIKKENDLTKPGGNPVWGTYAYSISKDAFGRVMDVLRNDVGALLWKSKRMRYYHVKPIDKILPRLIRELFGQRSVLLPVHPAFFRAPMLTSKIHSQWDPEFCKSTEYQLRQTNLSWSDLTLTSTEQKVVSHWKKKGEYLTPAQLDELEK